MDTTPAPYACIVVRLSEHGLRDAARQGVSAAEVEYLPVEPGTPEWDEFFALSPRMVDSPAAAAPEVLQGDSAGPVAGAELVIGRPIRVRVENAEPVEHSLGDGVATVPVWSRPELLWTARTCDSGAVFDGAPSGPADGAEPFDRYCSVAEYLAFERDLREAVIGPNALHTLRVAALVQHWRTWVVTEGCAAGETVLTAAADILAAHEGFATRPLLEEDAAVLRDALECVQGEGATRADARCTTLVAALDACRAAVENARRDVATREHRAAELREATHWVEYTGSARLTKALALGLLAESMGVYRDERLEHERPGWSWAAKGEEFKDIVNPSEDALDALLAARGADPTARLQWSSQGREPVVVGQFLSRSVTAAVATVLEIARGSRG